MPTITSKSNQPTSSPLTTANGSTAPDSDGTGGVGQRRGTYQEMKDCLQLAIRAGAVARPFSAASYLMSCDLNNQDDIGNTLECLRANAPYLFNECADDPGVTPPPLAVVFDRVDPEFLQQLLKRYDGERSAKAPRPRV